MNDWTDEGDKPVEIDYEDLNIGQSRQQPQIVGQIDRNGFCCGIGKKTSPYSLYEG
jgi:hypothetical protein